MALARVITGDPGVASNIDQFVDLLTGGMVDQPVTLSHSNDPLTIRNNVGVGILQVRSDNSPADPGMPWIRGDGNYIIISPRAGHDMYIMADGGSGILHLGSSSTVTVYVGEGTGPLYAGPTTLGALSAGASTLSSLTVTGAETVGGVTTHDANVNLPNVGTTWSNSGGSGFIVDRGSFSRTYSGSGNDVSTYSTNLDFNGRTPTLVVLCTNASFSTAVVKWDASISGNTITLNISGGDGHTFTFNWIAVG